MSAQHVWDLLAKREQQRMALLAVKRPSNPAEEFYAVTESRANRRDNRYANIYAYDRTAVPVNGDYLNANVVKDGYGRWWVACQAPLPHTVETFFSAIHDRAASKHPLVQAETDGAVIVQLTGMQESGVKKADAYLTMIKVDDVVQRPDISSVVSNFKLQGYPVKHYFFTAWPDFGIPTGESVEALRRLVLEIGEVGKGKEIWVHCSAGVGRSGTFIALSSLILPRGSPVQLPQSPMPPLPKEVAQDKVAVTLDGLRDWRGALIQTAEQYQLVHTLSRTDP